MHPALQIPELLYLVFRNLLSDRLDLLSCCLTCKTFSEPALDTIWEDIYCVTLLPFSSPSTYLTVYNSGSRDYDASSLSSHLERLKFYGKRIRVLRVHSRLSNELLQCIIYLSNSLFPDPSNSAPCSLTSTLFPSLTTLINVYTVHPLRDNATKARIRTFLVPSVRDFSLHCGSGSRYHDLTDALQAVNAVRPSLTSLTLGTEIISDFVEPPPDGLNAELSSLLHSLPELKELTLPLYLFSQPVTAAIASLTVLERLTVSHPNFIKWKPSSVDSLGNHPIQMQGPLPEGSFPQLRYLAINSTFSFIPQVLYADPAFTSHITHLSLSCLPPPPRRNLRSIFEPSLSVPALHSLTHLTLDFTVPISVPQRQGLGVDFFAPLLSAPFVPHLVSLEIQHRVPLDLSDQEFDNMARLLPELTILHLIATPFDPPRGVPRPPPLHLRASPAALVSFVKHCPRLREITLPVDAEKLPPLEIDSLPTALYPVTVNVSVSPVGPSYRWIVKMLVKLFPHGSSEISWVPLSRRASGGDAERKIDEAGNLLVDEDDDPRVVYAGRWKAINQLVLQEREAACH